MCHRGLIRRFRAPAQHSALSGLEAKITEQIHWRRSSLSFWAGWLSPGSGTVHLICNLLRGSTPMAARRHGRVSGRRNGRTWLAGLQLILLTAPRIDRSGKQRVLGRGGHLFIYSGGRMSPQSARDCFACLRCIARSADVDIGVPTLYLRGVVWGKGTGMNPTFGWTAEDAVQWDRQAKLPTPAAQGHADTRHVQ